MSLQAFERQPGETNKAYQAFTIYRDMGTDRTLENVARALGKSATLMERWSATYNWKARAMAFDNYLMNLHLGAETQAIGKKADQWAKRQMEHREEMWALRQQLVDKAKAMLAWPLYETQTTDGKTIVKPTRWGLADAARIVDTADKVGRLASELPTEIANLTPDLIALFNDLRKAGTEPSEFIKGAAQRVRAINER